MIITINEVILKVNLVFLFVWSVFVTLDISNTLKNYDLSIKIVCI